MRFNLAFIPLVSATLLFGCATQTRSDNDAPRPVPAADSSSSKKAKPKEEEATIIGTPAPRSKFAKLQIGMSMRQVEDLIGIPSDRKGYTTGKAFIPFYFGTDAYRFETFYKNEGRLTYEGGGLGGTSGKLIRIVVDANASGYQ
jgi:hypothetical protein